MSNRRMTNAQFYDRVEERIVKFHEFCRKHWPSCDNCELKIKFSGDTDPFFQKNVYPWKGYASCAFHWLEMEAPKELPMLCPYCKSPCTVENVCTNEDQTSKYVCCTNDKCMYQSANAKSEG